MTKFITLINDCNDDNAKARQMTHWSILFPQVHISYVGIDSNLGDAATIEAAGNLIDVLDAADGKEGVIAVNVAPRGQVKLDGVNGSLFSYFWHQKTLVVTTIKGYNLSLVKKLGLAKSVEVLDTATVLDHAAHLGILEKAKAEFIKTTQFRSLNFQPLVARWLIDGITLPSTTLSLEKIPDIKSHVWCIDSFGNIKTTATKEEIKNQKLIYPFFEGLKLIPDGATAIYQGSSGIGTHRFLEIATQNRAGSARDKLKAKVGDEIKIV